MKPEFYDAAQKPGRTATLAAHRAANVDLSTSPVQPHLYDAPRQSLYLDEIRDTLGPSVAAGDYDAIALVRSVCRPRLERPLRLCDITAQRATCE